MKKYTSFLGSLSLVVASYPASADLVTYTEPMGDFTYDSDTISAEFNEALGPEYTHISFSGATDTDGTSYSDEVTFSTKEGIFGGSDTSLVNADNEIGPYGTWDGVLNIDFNGESVSTVGFGLVVFNTPAETIRIYDTSDTLIASFNNQEGTTFSLWGVEATAGEQIGRIELDGDFFAIQDISYTISRILVTLDSLQDSLTSTASTGKSAMSLGDLVMHGSHSRPLSFRVAAGKKTFWVSGDWGQDNHDYRDGDLSLAEIGGGYNFGTAQVNFALGGTWANQNLSYDGDMDADGTYVYLEAMKPLSGDIWGVISGYYNWGDADVRRGYMVSDSPVFSDGDTDVDTWSIRARVEWDGLAKSNGSSISPYGEIAYTQTSVDGYTETTGDFPAMFHGRDESATNLRLGVNASKQLQGATFLLGQLEYVHNLADSSDNVTGEVVDEFEFSLDTPSYQQNWLRAGVGVEAQIGGGTGSLMLNGTTKGEESDVWLAARYQMAF